MGESKKIIISGLDIHDNNRGTAALGYGAISFLRQKGLLQKGDELINFHFYLNLRNKRNWHPLIELIDVDGVKWKHITYNINWFEKLLFNLTGLFVPFSNFKKVIKHVKTISAINGGDGFSDIYNTKSFRDRLEETDICMKLRIPLIILPQTIGPFEQEKNLNVALKILKYASNVYVRDDKFAGQLTDAGIKYEMTNDLSYYMQPQPWNFVPNLKAVGINVSGLAYFNHFRTLAGKFDCYENLIMELIKFFLGEGCTVYLISHSYNYCHPEKDNDDLEACKDVYRKMGNDDRVVLIDKDLTPPEVKYVISKMSFFIGTRMHANFAAIFTKVPVFGLAYSYKFQGAFEANGLYNQTYNIDSLRKEDIQKAIEEIKEFYKTKVSRDGN